MKRLTYPQAYNRIIDAYFKDEIKPMDSAYCFCGTLAPNAFWGVYSTSKESDYPEIYPYTYDEYRRMEDALFDGMEEVMCTKKMNVPMRYQITSDDEAMMEHPLYEDAVFNGMCKAFIVLQEIHESRNEIIDQEIPFKKRSLKPHHSVITPSR